MVGQKQRIIKRFEREAKDKYKKMEKAGIKITCLCDKPKWHLVNFNIDEIKQIINWKDDDDALSTKRAPGVFIERAGNITRDGTKAIQAICGTDEEYSKYVKDSTKSEARLCKCRKCGKSYYTKEKEKLFLCPLCNCMTKHIFLNQDDSEYCGYCKKPFDREFWMKEENCKHCGKFLDNPPNIINQDKGEKS